MVAQNSVLSKKPPPVTELWHKKVTAGRNRVALAAKVGYEIDPDNPYPDNFTGHIRATLRDGTVVEERQPHFRGGAHEPLTRRDVEEKFMLNARHGGWDAKRAKAALELMRKFYDTRIDPKDLRG